MYSETSPLLPFEDSYGTLVATWRKINLMEATDAEGATEEGFFN